MKFSLKIILIFLVFGCANNQKTYWCGDHPCINKKERQAYFKKNMVVEVKNINKKKIKEINDIEKILIQAKINEKNRISNEKKLAKIKKRERKEKLKKEKMLIKKAKLSKKNDLKLKKKKLNEINEKKAKQISSLEKTEKLMTNKIEVGSIFGKVQISDFKEIVEKITNRNKIRSYPDINKIPN